MLPSLQLLNKIENFIQEQGEFAYYCLFLLGEKAGLRVSEAVNFNLNLKKSRNLYLIQGKRHKKRTIFVDPIVINELQKNHWKAQQTNRFSYAHYLQRVKKELNISKNIELTPHTLRRCFATYQANSGMPLPVLQQVLGHSSIRTTALYWKNSDDPKEKVISDKWLTGKLPQEPPKAIEIKPKELIKPPEKENNGKIFLNIHQQINIFIQNNPTNSQQNFLTTENQLLQAKIKQLEQENNECNKIIVDLKNDKELAQKQLISEQNKNHQLELLLDLERAKNQALIKENNQVLHQQLIAQIEIKLK